MFVLQLVVQVLAAYGRRRVSKAWPLASRLRVTPSPPSGKRVSAKKFYNFKCNINMCNQCIASASRACQRSREARATSAFLGP
jgi:hypothetical protein